MQRELSQHIENSKNKFSNFDPSVGVSAAATTTSTTENEDKFGNEATDLSQNLISHWIKATEEIEALKPNWKTAKISNAKGRKGQSLLGRSFMLYVPILFVCLLV